MTLPRFVFLRPAAALSVAAAALMSATPALADLSAEQAWDDIVEWMEAGSGDLTFAEETRSGDTLTIRGIAARADGPEASSATLMDEITLTELGDGTVLLDLPDEIAVSTTVTTDGQEITNEIILVLKDDRIILSGDDTVDRYDFTVGEMSVDLSDVDAGDDAPEVPVMVTVVAAGIAGTYDITTEDARQIVSKATTDLLTMAVSGAAPEGSDSPGDFAFDLSMSNIQTSGNVTMPLETASTDFGEMIDAGFAYDASISYQDGRYAIKGNTPDGTFDFNSSSEAGTFNIAAGPKGLFLETGSRNVSMTVDGSQIPIPGLVWTMAESGSTLRMPLLADAAPQTFALGLKLVDLVVPDTLYGLFDPTGQFPREPASLELDLTGTAILSTDLTDPALEDMDTIPGELKTIDINTLLLSLAGAELTGDGAFAFATDANGAPVPDGAVNLMLSGGNALLDTLVAMGLIPEEQAMGARMMVGLFAQPGDGDDTLKSTIEVREGNQIFANGQRIR